MTKRESDSCESTNNAENSTTYRPTNTNCTQTLLRVDVVSQQQPQPQEKVTDVTAIVSASSSSRSLFPVADRRMDGTGLPSSLILRSWDCCLLLCLGLDNGVVLERKRNGTHDRVFLFGANSIPTPTALCLLVQ